MERNILASRDLILDQYSVLVSDYVQEIHLKREKIHCDILKNKDLICQFPEPIKLYQQFESDTNKYYQDKINNLNKY